jgi:hypothetical protein
MCREPAFVAIVVIENYLGSCCIILLLDRHNPS